MLTIMLCNNIILIAFSLLTYAETSHSSQWGVEGTVVHIGQNKAIKLNSSSEENANFNNAIPFLQPLQHQTVGRCKCLRHPTIKKRYDEAFQVVRVRVIREWTNGQFTRGGRLPQFTILEYKLQITAIFKGRGLPKNSFILAQTFQDPNLCGLRLRLGELYLLNLDDPSRRSAASFWKKNWYELYQCQYNYQWTKIDAKDIRFLIARSKWCGTIATEVRFGRIISNVIISLYVSLFFSMQYENIVKADEVIPRFTPSYCESECMCKTWTGFDNHLNDMKWNGFKWCNECRLYTQF